MSDNLVTEILNAASSQEHEVLIQDFNFDRSHKNELLFFFKPGCFTVQDVRHTQNIVEMAMTKLNAYNVSISGVLLLSGTRLDELGIMDRHYGYINKLSKQASTILTEEDFGKVQNSLEISSDFEEYLVLGGHEFLQKFDSYDDNNLDELWSSKKSVKLRSGFYLQQYEIDNQKAILINGFHPGQLAYFTNPAHKIVLFLLHSDTDWANLKWDLVGNTFPENAKEESIRGELFKHHDTYGLKNVSIANNIVHLSAGPFEALFEINNFLHETPSSNFELSSTNMFRLMKEKGLSEKDVTRCLSNPVGRVDDSKIDLFTHTEDKNSHPALADYIEYFADMG